MLKQRTKDIEIRCQAILRQLGKEQTRMSTGCFPIRARFTIARRHKEAFSDLVFVSLREYSVAIKDTIKKKKDHCSKVYGLSVFIYMCIT